MTEDEARELCRRLSAEHPDRHTHQWVATRSGEEWAVAKIGVPPADEAMGTEVRADERPPTPDDPRPPLPPWVGPA
jgi:hypothetical protein